MPPLAWAPPRRPLWHLVVAGLVGMVVGGMLVAGIFAVLVVTGAGEPSVDKYDAGDAVVGAEPGTCFTGRDLTAAEVPTVDCDESHAFEVFARRPALSGDDAPYPGEDLTYLADSICLEEFKAYVARSYYDSALEYTVLVPTRAAWSEGEHDVVCGLYHPDQSLEGTSKGSGR
jgi:hypothetical protein